MKINKFFQIFVVIQILYFFSEPYIYSSQKIKDEQSKKVEAKNKKEENKKKAMLEELKDEKKKIEKKLKELENDLKNKTIGEMKSNSKKEKEKEREKAKEKEKSKEKENSKKREGEKISEAKTNNKKENIKEKEQTKEKSKDKQNEKIKNREKEKEKEKEKDKKTDKKQEKELEKNQNIIQKKNNYNQNTINQNNIKVPKILTHKMRIFENNKNSKNQDLAININEEDETSDLIDNNSLLDNYPGNNYMSSKSFKRNIPSIRKPSSGADQNSLIKSESMEYDLPIINFDNTKKIDYYYPFFFKTKFGDFSKNLLINNISNFCLDMTCEICSNNQIDICKKCKHGFFLHLGKCLSRCPINYVADIYKGTCIALDRSAAVTNFSYLKAFTFGSCKNSCGKESIDCTCERTCVYQGNCCSDYHECEDLLASNINKSFECQTGNQTCEMCENFIHKEDPMTKGQILPFKCGKCKEGFYLRYGECVPRCHMRDRIISPNKICISTQKCLVENCAQCLDNNPSVCKNCFGGLFLSNNLCVFNCPMGLRADRISMTCVENPSFAWYWVYPSKTTCNRRCGMDVNSLVGMDCSCNMNCLQMGNCCQDFDDFCLKNLNIIDKKFPDLSHNTYEVRIPQTTNQISSFGNINFPSEPSNKFGFINNGFSPSPPVNSQMAMNSYSSVNHVRPIIVSDFENKNNIGNIGLNLSNNSTLANNTAIFGSSYNTTASIEDEK